MMLLMLTAFVLPLFLDVAPLDFYETNYLPYLFYVVGAALVVIAAGVLIYVLIKRHKRK